jgi:hypothetical protein
LLYLFAALPFESFHFYVTSVVLACKSASHLDSLLTLAYSPSLTVITRSSRSITNNFAYGTELLTRFPVFIDDDKAFITGHVNVTKYSSPRVRLRIRLANRVWRVMHYDASPSYRPCGLKDSHIFIGGLHDDVNQNNHPM